MMRSCARWLVALLALSALAGCASGPAADPRDPLEPLNRGVFAFNDALDRAVLEPVAKGYRAVTPAPVRSGVGNFFGNLEDLWSLVNNVLQLKAQNAAETSVRVGVNTVLGFFGVLDIASEMGIERHPEDFGQTLGRWGVGAGPYLVLPLAGPSTLRDVAALQVDAKGDWVAQIDHVPTRNSLKVLNLVDLRASLLRAGKAVDEASLDKYTFIREVALQRRRNAIYDGNPPEEAINEPKE